MTSYQITIGIEVHVQLNTKTKLFSPSSTLFGSDPNTQASIIDLGLPGVLPVLNRRAVEKALAFAAAINAKVNQHCDFSRKNYFYPDLPKGYQITQHANPIVSSGNIVIKTKSGNKTIRIHQAHLEEDAGKSIHSSGGSNIDLNRAGNPLLEIVSEPDINSIEEAVTYCKTLHHLVRFINICDGNMQQGNFRCDINVSLRPDSNAPLGTRVEIKNLNSFKFIEKALKFEINRQTKLLNAGQKITQETRLYDETKDNTRSMRSKEDANDYRYFPEPDVPPLLISDSWIKSAHSALPELPDAKFNRYTNTFGLPGNEAEALIGERAICEYFDQLVASKAPPKEACNWVLSIVLATIYGAELSLEEGFARMPSTVLADILNEVDQKNISHSAAKQVFEHLFNTGDTDVSACIDAMGLRQISDESIIGQWIDDIMSRSQSQVDQYRAGNDRLFGFFVGQVMKASKGKADPSVVNQLLKRKLANDQ